VNLAFSRPTLGVLAAIAVTTTMDASGLTQFSALPLLPLMLLLWAWERCSRREMGFGWGNAQGYGLAVLYPLAVLSLATLAAAIGGAIDTSDADWRKAGLNMAIGAVMGSLMTFLTEEGFFRGWLLASLGRAGLSGTRALVWSSVAFSLWHVSWVTIPATGANLPAAQVLVYLINVVVIGSIWGMLRLLSGSVLVASVSHAVWNAIAYELFAFGTKTGALGIEQTAVYGPEVGVVGLALNLAFAALLWRWWRRRRNDIG